MCFNTDATCAPLAVQRKLEPAPPIIPVHTMKSLSHLRLQTGRAGLPVTRCSSGGKPSDKAGGGQNSTLSQDLARMDLARGAESGACQLHSAQGCKSTGAVSGSSRSPKRKLPTSSDLAKLSMYLTAQQHNRLKQHIQQARGWLCALHLLLPMSLPNVLNAHPD